MKSTEFYMSIKIKVQLNRRLCRITTTENHDSSINFQAIAMQQIQISQKEEDSGLSGEGQCCNSEKFSYYFFLYFFAKGSYSLLRVQVVHQIKQIYHFFQALLDTCLALALILEDPNTVDFQLKYRLQRTDYCQQSLRQRLNHVCPVGL